jgi:hypothetical protein
MTPGHVGEEMMTLFPVTSPSKSRDFQIIAASKTMNERNARTEKAIPDHQKASHMSKVVLKLNAL